MHSKTSSSRWANIRINVDEDYEVRHWARQLGVTAQKIIAAVEQVGPLVDDIRLHLKAEIAPDNPWYPRRDEILVKRRR